MTRRSADRLVSAHAAYLEQCDLVVPERTPKGYRLYGLRELNVLRSLNELARHSRWSSPTSLSPLGCGASLTSEPRWRRGSPARAVPHRPTSNGNSGSRSVCSPPDERTGWQSPRDTTSRIWRWPPRASRGSSGPTGRCRCCAAIRERFGAEQPLAGLSHLRLPARDDRDRQPRAHAHRPAARTSSSAPPTRSRRRTTSPRRSSTSTASPSSRSRARTTTPTTGTSRPRSTTSPHITIDDGADVDQRPPLAPARAARRRHRRDRGDDDRRHPPARAGARRRARLPGHRRQRRRHEALLRQPLRHRPVDDRRHHPRHQRPARRQARSSSPATAGAASGVAHAGQGHGRPRDRDRGRPAAGARGGHGRLRGHADGRAPRRSATSSSPPPATSASSRRALRADEGRRHPRQLGPLQRRDRHRRRSRRWPTRAAQAAAVRRGVHARRRPAAVSARRRPADQPGRRRGPPGQVMDMSFANQALSAEFVVQNAGTLDRKVYPVPAEIDKEIARLKLDDDGRRNRPLTEEQAKYLGLLGRGDLGPAVREAARAVPHRDRARAELARRRPRDGRSHRDGDPPAPRRAGDRGPTCPAARSPRAIRSGRRATTSPGGTPSSSWRGRSWPGCSPDRPG